MNKRRMPSPSMWVDHHWSHEVLREILYVFSERSTKLAEVSHEWRGNNGQDWPALEMTIFPSTSTSILVRRKQASASSGLHTTGSFSLNEVLSSMGTPVIFLNASIRP